MYQLIYYIESGERILEHKSFRNRAAIRKYLKGVGIIGHATIYEKFTGKLFYYKPRV
jgi:hypothetical protein